jgi:cytoplasmic iron level regulating protein YaaA (DUF328/UPF0246 family)
VLILLPPSEGKHAPLRGKPLDLEALSSPDLTRHRSAVLDSLVALCAGPPQTASSVLGTGPTLAGELARNASLASAPTAAARSVYSGVLYDALGLADLPSAAARRATRSVLIFSALFGALRTTDRIAAYRLSGGVDLPGIGRVASSWSAPLSSVVPDLAGHGMVIDLRSGTYMPMWRPRGDLASRTVRIRVVADVDGQRLAVTHQNKVTKGRLARSLLLSSERPRSRDDLADHLGDLGWTVVRSADGRGLDVLAD